MKSSPGHSLSASLFVYSALLFAVFSILIESDAQTASAPANLSSVTLPGAPTQLTAEDYARSSEMRPFMLLSKLKNGFVVPHWIGKHDEFWYMRGTAKGREYLLVDAASGRAQPAFDHQALAQAFAKVAGFRVTAEALPFEDFTFNDDRSTIHIKVGNKEFDCKLQPASCAPGTLVFPPPAYDITFFAPKARGQASDPNEGVLFSPDKKWGVFTRDNNLWLREVTTQQDRQLTRDGVEHFGYGTYLGVVDDASIPRERALEAGHHLLPMDSYWSPDSRTVIVSHADERHVADYPYLETVPADGSFRPKLHTVRMALVGEKPPALEWFAFDIPIGTYHRINFPYDKLLAVDPDGLPVRKKWWSADGRHLYALAVGDNMESGFLFDVDIATGNVRTVIEEHMSPRMEMSPNPWDSPDVWISADGKDAIWFSERDGWGHLYLYDGQTGKMRNQITRGEWLVRDIIKVDQERRRIYFTGSGREAGNPYYRYLYRVNFDGSHLELLSPEPADHMLTSQEDRPIALDAVVGYDVVSPSGKFVVYNFSTPDQPPQAVIRSTDGKLISTLEKADATGLFAAHYRPPEEFVAKAADGKTDLWCLIYKPSNFDPTRRYPVIDLEYATPVTAVVPRNFLHAIHGVPALPTNAMLSELGFIVVAIDARGTPYRSRQFSQAGFGELNIIGLDDHVAVIKQLGERLTYVDLSRVGIVGDSFGGWSAIWGMLNFPDFFKVGVAQVPPGGMHNVYPCEEWYAYQGPPVYSDGSHLRPKPDEVPENWKAIDMRQKAASLKGHLLILMAELDENVPPGSTNQFLDALIKADKDFDLVYLMGAGHATQFAAYTIRRTDDYLVRYLMGASPPAH
jgi:dipeptidyl aminopeptidase/acylaminoacyl peptidase